MLRHSLAALFFLIAPAAQGQTLFSGGYLPGKATINISGAGAFINFMKGYQSQAFAGTDTPAVLDVNGYPQSTLNANLGGSIDLPAGYAGASVDWVLKWPATRNIRVVINVAVTKSSCTFATCTGGSNSVLTAGGAGGRAVFRFNSYSSTNISFYFPLGAFYSAGSGEIALVRSTDEAAYDAGEYFTPEFVAVYTPLRVATIRMLGWTNSLSGNYNGQVQWSYRTSPSRVSWLNTQWPPGAWAGTISGTDTYTVGNAPDSNPAAYTAGEVVQANITNANTSTTPVLNRNSLGAKTIVNTSAGALSAGSIAANAIGTFVYDDLLDKFIYRSDGLTQSVPLEVQVAFANKIKANLWINYPPMGNDDYFTQITTYVAANLSSGLSFYPEYGNEIWNFVFPSTNWAFQRGLALGFPNNNNRPVYGWYGLRARQMHGIVTALWGSRGGLNRVGAVQNAGATGIQDTYRFQGADLSTSLGYTVYNSYVGVSYNIAPNRPIDYIDVISPAFYYQGASMNDGFSYTALPAANVTILQAMADNYTLGTPASLATALASLDADIRSGTRTGSAHPQTLDDFVVTYYPAWEAIAASYTGKTVRPYEGGLQAVPPTAAQATTLGITVGGSGATASQALVDLLALYKNTGAYGGQIVGAQFNQFLAQPHSRQPAWLIAMGTSNVFTDPWALMQGSDPFTAPYQTYNGFANFN